jgi:hypothetical protein
MIQISQLVLLWLILIFFFSSTQQVAADEGVVSANEPTTSDGLFQKIRDGFTARVNILGFGIIQEPVNSLLNPNNINGIPQYVTEVDLRPDFYLNLDRLELALKPRLDLNWQKWNSGPKRGSQGDADPFIQEGIARYRIIDPLIISYGLENLQWGPSYLLSPSSPFNQDNGKNNPMLEVPALGYGRILWLPTDQWTLSFIANTFRGNETLIRDFQRGYAVKVDYSGGGKYLTFIPSYREDGRFRFGFYAGWTVSDALLLHAEGSFSKTEILVGGSYTLELGPTIVAEYFRNQGGCTRMPFDLCFPPFSTVGTVEPALTLFRRNYLLLQYNHTRIRDTADVIVRWIHDLDDNSNRIVNILQYDIGKHTQLFAVADIFPAPNKTEFGSFLDYSVMLGVRFAF